jgi:LPS O-antigen subunit length determinant protein (WzzB/FepE family)
MELLSRIKVKKVEEIKKEKIFKIILFSLVGILAFLLISLYFIFKGKTEEKIIEEPIQEELVEEEEVENIENILPVGSFIEVLEVFEEH